MCSCFVDRARLWSQIWTVKKRDVDCIAALLSTGSRLVPLAILTAKCPWQVQFGMHALLAISTMNAVAYTIMLRLQVWWFILHREVEAPGRFQVECSMLCRHQHHHSCNFGGGKAYALPESHVPLRIGNHNVCTRIWGPPQSSACGCQQHVACMCLSTEWCC